jgi:hypothetical protein
MGRFFGQPRTGMPAPFVQDDRPLQGLSYRRLLVCSHSSVIKNVICQDSSTFSAVAIHLFPSSIRLRAAIGLSCNWMNFLEPMGLLGKPAALVPPPGFNLVRYHGILAASARWRSRIVPVDSQDGVTSGVRATQVRRCPASAAACNKQSRFTWPHKPRATSHSPVCQRPLLIGEHEALPMQLHLCMTIKIFYIFD